MLKKRFIKPIAACAMIIALSLSACGKNDDKTGGTESGKTTQATEVVQNTENAQNPDISQDTETGTTESTGNNTGKDEMIPYTSGVLTFSAASGVYENEFSLEITSTDTEYKEIWYTIDGSDPASSDTAVKYEEAVQIRDRKDDPNIVSAVSPDLFCTNYSNAKKAEKTFECYIQPPADADVDKCMTVRAVAKNAEGEISEEANAVYFIGTMEEHIQGFVSYLKRKFLQKI